MSQIGDLVNLSTTFLVDGAPEDPQLVTLEIGAPGAEPVTHTYDDPEDATIVRDGPGAYHADILANLPGTWIWRWVGAGEATGADQGTFFVSWSLLEPDYGLLCTPEEVRDVLGDGLGGASDQLIRRLIAAASEAIMREAACEFAPPAEALTRRFRLDGTTILGLEPFSLRQVSALSHDPDGAASALVAETDYVLHPLADRHGVYCWIEFTTRRRGVIEIVGDWGYASVPEDVREACITQVREWNVRDVSRFGEAFSDAEGGGVSVPQRALSRHAWDVAHSYRRQGVVV